MHKIFILARREYIERVRTKTFIVTTILIPALMLGAVLIPSALESKGSNETRRLLVVAPDTRTAELIQAQLNRLSQQAVQHKGPSLGSQKGERTRGIKFNVDISTDTSDSARAGLTEKVKQKQLDGVIFATAQALDTRKIVFITHDVSSFALNSEIEQSIADALQHDFLKNKGLSDQDIETALQPVELDTQSSSMAGNPVAVFAAVVSMVMLLYGTVLWYGVSVIRAIVDEKTSRVMEVMLATARPTELMAGKILGVGAVGLTQVVIWSAAAIVATSPGLIAGAGMLKGILSAGLIVNFATFFLLGYALYSTLCAAVGAMVNSEQEAQQLQIVVMAPMIVSVLIMVNVISYPASQAAVWASLFPLTAPLIMFLRVALQSPPFWQVALSIVLMIATIFGLIWVCGRIYRVGILMYGKRPTLPEIMKWIRYS